MKRDKVTCFEISNPFVCPYTKSISDNFIIDTDDDILSAALFEIDSFRHQLGNIFHCSDIIIKTEQVV